MIPPTATCHAVSPKPFPKRETYCKILCLNIICENFKREIILTMWNISCTRLYQSNSVRKSHNSETLSQGQTSNEPWRKLWFRFSHCECAHFTSQAAWQPVRWNLYPLLTGHHILRSRNYLGPNTLFTYLHKITEESDHSGEGDIKQQKMNEVKETNYVTIGKSILFRVLKIVLWRKNSDFLWCSKYGTLWDVHREIFQFNLTTVIVTTS